MITNRIQKNKKYKETYKNGITFPKKQQNNKYKVREFFLVQ